MTQIADQAKERADVKFVGTPSPLQAGLFANSVAARARERFAHHVAAKLTYGGWNWLAEIISVSVLAELEEYHPLPVPENWRDQQGMYVPGIRRRDAE